MKEKDLSERIVTDRIKFDGRVRRRKRITPKQVFLQFLHRLFAASLLGKVDWRPIGTGSFGNRFQATFGAARVTIVLCEGTYLVEVVFPTIHGDFSIDGETSSARVGTFKSVFWAAVRSFEVRKMLNRKALPVCLCGETHLK